VQFTELLLMIPAPIVLYPIGHVRSPYTVKGDAPRQGRFSDTVSEIVIDAPYLPALFRLEERKQLWVLCWFDRADRTVLMAIPPGTSAEKGVFSTRSPNRPNPVALCMVDLLGVKDGVLKVRGLDALDGTPVIDIKMYSPAIDCPTEPGAAV
jgi:tRNA (adenine37-N6)-methyltransferase